MRYVYTSCRSLFIVIRPSSSSTARSYSNFSCFLSSCILHQKQKGSNYDSIDCFHSGNGAWYVLLGGIYQQPRRCWPTWMVEIPEKSLLYATTLFQPGFFTGLRTAQIKNCHSTSILTFFVSGILCSSFPSTSGPSIIAHVLNASATPADRA